MIRRSLVALGAVVLSLLLVISLPEGESRREPTFHLSSGLTGLVEIESNRAIADFLRGQTTTTTTRPRKTTTVSAASVGRSVLPSDDIWYKLFGCETGGTYN